MGESFLVKSRETAKIPPIAMDKAVAAAAPLTPHPAPIMVKDQPKMEIVLVG